MCSYVEFSPESRNTVGKSHHLYLEVQNYDTTALTIVSIFTSYNRAA